MLGQYRYSKSANRAGSYVGATFEMGFTTFFGDIDEGPAKGDITNNLTYKFMMSKNIKSVVEFSGRISFGGMSGEKQRTNGGVVSYLYFQNKFTEYSFDLGVNLMSFFRAQDSKFGLYGSIGVGLIDFKVKLYDGTNDSVVQSYGYDGKKSTTEFVIPLGVKAIYHISSSSAVSLQTTISWVDTDKLDGKTGNDNTDYYNFLSLGYTYKIGGTRSSGGSKSLRLNQSRSRYR